jgi:2-oxoglutarate dehydrogenase E1 component
MIDQFISGAEQKWNRMNGLVMLLPHGYEGQGPEHSSARLERFLQMCAELNMVVTNITTASNFFHALRRQMAWSFRKPLINLSPKANLRHPGTYSDSEEFTHGCFKEVIDDVTSSENIKKVILCSGKVYFDLNEFRLQNNISDTAIVRVEQLYPLPVSQLQTLLKKYPKVSWKWVQEEPLNMGAAAFLRMNLDLFPFKIVARNASAATATGYNKIHLKEQQELIKQAFS